MNFDFSPLLISLKTSLASGILVFILGVGTARLLMNIKDPWRWLADVVFTLPLVLPPTVVGFLLLVFFGKNSPVGRMVGAFGHSIIFTWEATVIASVVVAFPLMYRAAKGAFEQVDENMIWAARTLGMSELSIFFKVLIPQALPGIGAGAVLSFARALGEFGATLMIAGNIPEITQTIPLAIYFATASGNMKLAAKWVGIIMVLSCLSLWLMNRFSRRDSRAAREETP